MQILIFVFLFGSLEIKAQELSTYGFSSTQDTYQPITGGSIIGNRFNNNESSAHFILASHLFMRMRIYSIMGKLMGLLD